MSRLVGVVVEAEASQRHALEKALFMAWPELFVARTCASGREAIDTLNSFSPDVLFLNLRMPASCGLKIAKAASPSTHVVFLTAYEEWALRVLEDGAIDYLLKPLELNRAQSVVRRLRLRVELRRPRSTSESVDWLEAHLSRMPQNASSFHCGRMGQAAKVDCG